MATKVSYFTFLIFVVSFLSSILFSTCYFEDLVISKLKVISHAKLVAAKRLHIPLGTNFLLKIPAPLLDFVSSYVLG